MDTFRNDEGILQVAHDRDGHELYEINLTGIKRAAAALTMLENSGFTPSLIYCNTNHYLQEDLGISESVDGWASDDWQDFRRALVRALITMRQKGIRHGDLNGNNIIIKNKKPYIIDWQESHKIGEEPPQVRPFTDTHFILQDLIRWVDDPEISDPYRVTRRWAAIYYDLTNGELGLPLRGKTLLDIGCFQGDFCAFAAAELMYVTGIDVGTFRHNEKSIKIAKELWADTDNLMLWVEDVINIKHFNYDVVLFMDTFPYIVRDYGKDKAIEILRKIINEAGVVYFETQMNGDKSGIEWLNNDADVISMAEGVWAKLATFPEAGFPRTLWRIQNGHN